MKLFAWLLVLILSGTAWAQNKKGKGGPPSEEILGGTPEFLKEELALSDEAAAIVTEFYEKTLDEMRALAEAAGKKVNLRDAARVRLLEMLSTEYKERYAQFLIFKEAAKDFGFPTSALRRDLQAGDDQIRRIYQLVDDETRRIRTLEQEAKTKLEKEQAKIEGRKKMAELKETVLSELSAEQRQKLQNFSPPTRGPKTPEQIVQRLGVDDSKKEDVLKALTDLTQHVKNWEGTEKALRDELNKLIDAKADESEIHRKLEDLRSRRQEHETTLKDLQERVRALCNATQQAILVVERILP